ncbi:MAG: hypothetical protein BGO39_03510 [Chloroflexi bacterium 54-19]|nr:MAG: hypothetical protein BGO39_03510 [Chloroflexi bacterium 54-19]
MNRLTSREVVFGGARPDNAGAVNQPFGESLREQLEKEASSTPIREVALTQLTDNPFQKLARPSYDENAMAELVSSIRQNGFYGALLARRKRGLQEQYELAFGHRRKEAARQAGITSLPVKIIDLSDTQMARIMASENFAREDLTPLGEANVIGHLNIEQNLSAAEISKIVGKGEGWIKLRLALYNAPADIKEMVRQKPETLGHIRLLSQAKDPSQRASFINEVLAGSLTREQLQARLKSGTSEIVDPAYSQAHSDDTPTIVTSFTNGLQYTDSEKRNNRDYQGEPESGQGAGTMAANTPDYRSLYKTNLKKMSKVLSELEGLSISKEAGAAPNRAEKAQIKELSERLAKLWATG